MNPAFRPYLLPTLALIAGLAALGWQQPPSSMGWPHFPLDDAYIHASVARQFSETAVWGLNAGEFAGASSSPAWTLLLAAGFGLVGPQLWLLFVLNLVLGFGALAGIMGLSHPSSNRTLVGLAAVAAVPLPYLIFLGMEHTLQLVVALLMARSVIQGGTSRMAAGVSVAIAGFAPMVRYELIFPVMCLAALSAVEGRWRLALAMVSASASSVILFGAWSMANGGFFLPNSLLMKSALVGGWWHQWEDNFSAGAPVLLLAVASLAATSPIAKRHSLVYAGTVLLHLAFAKVGWLHRYEAWLIGWGLPLAWNGLSVLGKRVPSSGLLAWAFILISLGQRSVNAVTDYGLHLRIMLDNDIRIARFIGQTGVSSVALHNIGVASWINDEVNILDVAGLASNEVCQLHLGHQLSGTSIATLVGANEVELAAFDQGWLPNDMPPNLLALGSLTFPLGDRNTTATTKLWVGPSGSIGSLQAGIRSAAAQPDEGIVWTLSPN